MGLFMSNNFYSTSCSCSCLVLNGELVRARFEITSFDGFSSLSTAKRTGDVAQMLSDERRMRFERNCKIYLCNNCIIRTRVGGVANFLGDGAFAGCGFVERAQHASSIPSSTGLMGQYARN
jgi:hypothetical protein